MAKQSKFLKNDLFHAAMDYLFRTKKVAGKGELARRIGISPSTLSHILSYEQEVSDETLYKLNDAFEGIFNMEYFRGRDLNHMLLSSFTEEPKEHTSIDPSSAVSSALSAQMETISTLKQTIADMKEAHQRELAAKDAHITDLTKLAEERLHRIAELRRIIDTNNMTDYPFPIGAADEPNKQAKRI